jgi:transcriptional regulator with XRE-family HTH domain
MSKFPMERPTPEREAHGKFLQQRRESMGLTQEQVAASLRISVMLLGEVELGRIVPPLAFQYEHTLVLRLVDAPAKSPLGSPVST